MSKQRENKSKGRASSRGYNNTRNQSSSGNASVQKKNTQNKVSNPDTIRLNKYVANSGMCSRREADVHIATGLVSVNGKIVTEMGYKVKLTQRRKLMCY